MTQMKLLATRIPGFTTPAPAASTKVKRRGEIPLEDVLTTAETIAEHFGGTGLQVNLSTGPAQPVSVLPPAADKTTVKREVSAHLEGFHAEIASLKDQSVNQEKRFQESIAKMEANLKQSFNQSVRDSPPHKDIVPAGEASNRHPQVQQNYLGNEAQQFIQLPAPVAGHYQEKLTDYPLLTGPLHDLIKSNAEWKWGNRQEDAFIELKHHLYLFVRREVRKRQNDGKVDLDETPPPSGKSSPPRKIQLDDDYSEEEPPEVEFVRIVDQSNNANSGVRKIPKTPKPQATCANPETRDSKRVGWTHREYLGT
ncbi:hypothetical protein C8F04DRAFT_1178190 [Mycena alexandri]|uniref:Uncharacterized protein n=1 Tax=Mycena alexandri TaxID=1745969 RepID=A0AAD6X9Q1_9AGAR|nr:hypothetical protein C8F04DRAFT_1178190 [Mycena alexandri]